MKIRGSLGNCNIDNSVHVANSDRFCGMIRRPNSMFQESFIASLTSCENSIEGLLLYEEPCSNERSTPLVHIAKNRPKPARHLKTKVFNFFF